MRLDPGTAVRCSDDAFGELADVIVDPIEKRVTHLVVQPHGKHEQSRLVPVALSAGGDEQIQLRCTVEEVAALPHVQEFAYVRLGQLRLDDPEWDVGIETLLAMPYYAAGMDEMVPYDSPVPTAYDRVPKGEVEIRRASSVASADGHCVGEVDGFVVDDEGQITHLVLERGHLWGRREVTIPIAAVAEVKTDMVTVSLTKDALAALPAVRVHRWSP